MRSTYLHDNIYKKQRDLHFLSYSLRLRAWGHKENDDKCYSTLLLHCIEKKSNLNIECLIFPSTFLKDQQQKVINRCTEVVWGFFLFAFLEQSTVLIKY